MNRNVQYTLNVKAHNGVGTVVYLCLGLLAAYCLGMSMDSPLTWLTILLWPMVLILKMFALAVEIFLAVAVLGVLFMAVNAGCNSIRNRIHGRAMRRGQALLKLAQENYYDLDYRPSRARTRLFCGR